MVDVRTCAGRQEKGYDDNERDYIISFHMASPKRSKPVKFILDYQKCNCSTSLRKLECIDALRFILKYCVFFKTPLGPRLICFKY